MDIQDHEIYKDSNKAAMDYAKDAIRFAFFLNGAAATALFAKVQVVFVFPAALFAIGAALAVFCMGFSYIVQLALAETWRQGGPRYSFHIGPKEIFLTRSTMETGRLVAIVFWLSSMILFFCGADSAWQAANALTVAV